ncbi:hypothetical protein CaCOL14_007034 [Colletotrichum acutatum]|uniref:Uncharacterized protein n=1 Tax=Glomerella acutata TaxID=27357 RepID=A0AAD8XCG2_GLOAC|nr:uncharacterized protein BDZ83DRAFT_754620 [Colletotrichum acutatum]KAK1721401.1 hypothetical protein BDZ83DRAFT_754620 [Colletotrichum acutatum]
MSTNGEAERKPSRPAWRRAVLAHIKLSTLERRKHHTEEQQRSVTPFQVAYNQQDIVEPAPVHLNGNSRTSFVEDLEIIAEEINTLHPNAMDTHDFLTSEEIYDSGPITQPASIGHFNTPNGGYLISPLASLLVSLDHGYNRASGIYDKVGDRSEQDEDSSNEGLIPPHNTPVDSGDVSPVNTPARAPSLDRGPSIRLQRALAEDQAASEPLKRPISELVASSEPLSPSGTQNGLLQAAERAGVWRNMIGMPFTEEEKMKLVQKRRDHEAEMVRRLRAGLETKIEKRPCYLLWLEGRHQLSTERMLASATIRLADYAEGHEAVGLFRERRRRQDFRGQASV